MKWTMIILLASLLPIGAATQETGFIHAKPMINGNEQDIKDIKITLTHLYNALGQGDAVTYSALVTADYYVLEQGEYWSREYAISQVAELAGTNYVRTDHLDFRIIDIEGNMASVVWDLEAEILRDGEAHIRRWLESGWLRKEYGRWKVAVLHSTRIER